MKKNGHTLKIEKGIPIPDGGRGRHGKYPFPSMKVGDSFFFDSNDNNRVASSALQWGRRHSMKFTVRKIDGGFRCWRIK